MYYYGKENTSCGKEMAISNMVVRMDSLRKQYPKKDWNKEIERVTGRSKKKTFYTYGAFSEYYWFKNITEMLKNCTNTDVSRYSGNKEELKGLCSSTLCRMGFPMKIHLRKALQEVIYREEHIRQKNSPESLKQEDA